VPSTTFLQLSWSLFQYIPLSTVIYIFITLFTFMDLFTKVHSNHTFTSLSLPQFLANIIIFTDWGKPGVTTPFRKVVFTSIWCSQCYQKRPRPRTGLGSPLRANPLRKLGRKLASWFKNALLAQKLIFFVLLSRVRVWSVVRDGLGESEEGIKDISPLNSTHPSN
jgi:hypothetical protein